MRRRGHAATIAITLMTVLAAAGTAMANEPAPHPISGDVIGELRSLATSHEDTLLDVARDNGLGYVEMIAANPGVDPWLPGERTRIVLPTAHILPDVERLGLVVNLAEHRLYYFGPPGSAPMTFPMGVGMEGWSTPLGGTEIARKKERPIWFPPDSIRAETPGLPAAVPPGPDNPLGSHALYFGWPNYLIHGTNNPWGIGRRVSHGCIRLYPEDIVRLFRVVELGTPVNVIDQAVKVGWSGGELYVEAHPDPRQADDLERSGRITRPAERPLADTFYRIVTRAGTDRDRLNWPAIRRVLRERSGAPVRVTGDHLADAG